MLDDFKVCRFEGVYLSSSKADVAKHSYFQKRNLIPYKKENSLAYYKIDEIFLGMPVSEIVIPITYDYHIITFDLSIEKVISILNKNFQGQYRTDERKDDGSIPVLKRHPKDPTKTIFYCSDI